MASLDEVVSNLKNVVTNLSGLATGTSLVNSIGTLTIAINAISSTLATSLATTHVFGGSLTMSVGTVTVVSDANVRANSRITCFPTNTSAGSLIFDQQGFYTSAKTISVSFTLQTVFTSALGTETYDYIGFNP